MTKQEFIRQEQVNRRYPPTVQAMVGRLYDAAYKAGKHDGFRDGVRKGTESAISKLADAYSRGFQEAQEVDAATFLACMSLALHELHGFAAVRLRRVADRVAHLMKTTLHPSQWAEACAKIGVTIETVDALKELDEGRCDE